MLVGVVSGSVGVGLGVVSGVGVGVNSGSKHSFCIINQLQFSQSASEAYRKVLTTIPIVVDPLTILNSPATIDLDFVELAESGSGQDLVAPAIHVPKTCNVAISRWCLNLLENITFLEEVTTGSTGKVLDDRWWA